MAPTNKEAWAAYLLGNARANATYEREKLTERQQRRVPILLLTKTAERRARARQT